MQLSNFVVSDTGKLRRNSNPSYRSIQSPLEMFADYGQGEFRVRVDGTVFHEADFFSSACGIRFHGDDILVFAVNLDTYRLN